MRKHGRRDQIHAGVREVFRACGWRWLDLGDLGDDAPDALVYQPSSGAWRLLEIKTGKAKLKPGQEAFAADWPVSVIRSVDQAVTMAAWRF